MTNCPECGIEHDRAGMFCCRACQRRFNNRRATRGAIVYDVLMSKRFDRAGEFSGINEKEARQLLDTLAAEWRREDQDAGRARTWNKVSDWIAKNPWVGNFRRTFNIRVGR